MNKILRGMVAALILCAIAGVANAQTLTFPTWQAEDKSFGPWWKSVVTEFEARHPGVKIEMTSVDFAHYVDQLTVQFAAGTPPDIVHLPSRSFEVFAGNGWLAPLDDRLAQTDILQNWSPLQKGMQWDGKNEGILLMGYGSVLFYNKALLDKAGVAVPTTVDEMIAAAQKITDRDAGVFGFGGITMENSNVATDLDNWVIGQGAAFFKDGKYNLTSPEVIAALDKYRLAYHEAPPGIATAQLNQLFLDGKIGLFMGGPWYWPTYKLADGTQMPDAGMTYVPFPHNPGAMSNSLHIAAATDPAKQELAWEFIKLIAEPKFQESYTKLSYSPASRVGSLSPETVAADPVLGVVAGAAAKAVDILPPVAKIRANYGEYANYMTQAGIRMQSTDDSTEQIMKDTQAELEQRIPL